VELFKKIFAKKTTFGTLSLALFSYVLISGILLAIPYNVDHPYKSISNILIMNPWASFIRNLHYWSAQLFLVFTFIHLYDHFHQKIKIGFKKALAFQLSLGVLIILLAMLTGFLLKGDPDSQQARLILHSLLQRIPIAGNILAYSLLGNSSSYQLIYVHHIATFTIFITIIIIEHAKRFWPTKEDFVFIFIVLLFLSFLWTAPLHDNLNPTVKGPWYFVGLQEILHWLSHPEWILLLILILLVLVYLVNEGKGIIVFISKRTLLLFIIFYFILTIIGLFFRGESWRWTNPWQQNYRYSVLENFKTERVNFYPSFTEKAMKMAPAIMGRQESCMVCHNNTHGFTNSHNPQAIGCFSCHGGNPFATSKNQAHKGMLLIPGNLSTSVQSCGTAKCHPQIVQRVPTSIMSTLSGMISVDKYVFGEQKSPDILTSVHHLGNSAADMHLKNLCIRCHLGNPKKETGPISESSRGGGCLACHLNYGEKSLSAWEEHKKNPDDTAFLHHHAQISLNISDNHCFGCHSRSGRISTSYEGWSETTLTPKQMPDNKYYRLVEKYRVFKKEPADIHHTLGMECIDCHNSYEIMGNGKHYAHEEDQEIVQCIDCHFKEKPKLTNATNLSEEAAIITSLRYGSVTGVQFLTTHKRNRALVNTRYKNDTAFLFTKSTNKTFTLKKVGSTCNRNSAHQDLACSSCHSAWAPTCLGCHTSYDPNETGYNGITDKIQKGSWVEYTGSFLAKPPTLGMRIEKGKKEVIPVIPGMILSIDLSSFSKKLHDSLLFRRLFAPIAPHTTSIKGRSCKSCHNNPLALGYGSGKLKYVIKNNKGHWKFYPEYENNPHDGLPEDAWIGFLRNRTGMVSTRTNVKPFNIVEQQKILTVGACLTCHKETSKVMQRSLNNFSLALRNRTSKCILPDWNK